MFLSYLYDKCTVETATIIIIVILDLKKYKVYYKLLVLLNFYHITVFIVFPRITIIPEIPGGGSCNLTMPIHTPLVMRFYFVHVYS